jgi:hypothetical protein
MSSILIITFSSCSIASDIVARPSTLCVDKNTSRSFKKRAKQKW